MKKWLLTLITVASASVISLQAQTYCTTGLYTTGCSVGDNLDNVTIGTLVQVSTGCSTSGYGNYTTDTISIAQTEATTIALTSGYSNQWYGLWIDANDDGDFADAGEFLWNSTSASGTAGTATTGSFVIPTTALVGTHRLRVRGHYAGTAFTAAESCSSFTYGETHDYIVNVLAPPVCPAPYSASTSAVTAYTSTLHWVSTGTAFSIEYGLAGFTLGSGTTVTSTVDSVVLTGLTPASNYTFYVQNNCTSSSNGLSNWSGAGSFTTGCAPIPFPYSQNFDLTPTGNSTNPSAPQCWTYLESPGHAGYGYTYAFSNPNSAPNHWYWYNSSNITDTMLLVSPNLIGLDSSDKQVVFWAKSNNSSYTSPCVVGTMSDPNDISTFHAIATVNAGQNYSEFTVQIDAANGYNGTDDYVAFLYKSPVTYRYLYLDDISFESIPACPKPLFITLGTTTSSTQDISWTSGGSAFSLEWGPTGFTQGTGATGTSTTTSYTMTGLSPNTTYDVYIQNNCAGAGNGLSVWNGPVTFKTECVAFVGSFTETFESTTSGTSSIPSPPDCWKYSMTTHGGYGYAYTRNYLPYAHSGSQLFYMYHSNITDTMGLVTPEIGGMDTADKHIQFWARGAYNGTSYNEHIIVGTLSDPNDMSTMSTIDTVLITGTTYQYFDVYLDAANGYNGTDKHIVLAAWTGTSTYGYFILDDITVSDIPSCTPSTGLTVSNVTNTNADLSWLAGDGLAYNIEYGPTGFTQGTGPVITGITGTSYTLTGLSGNTCYDVYVRDSCALATSPWFGPITFCSACDPMATPIVEDFEMATPGNSTTPTAPDCWTNWKSSSASGYAYVYQYGTPNGTQHFYIYNYNSATDTIGLISPAVMGITNGDKVLKFKAKSNTTTSGTWAIVGTSSSSQGLENSTILDTIYTASQYGTEYVVHLDAASGYNGTDQYVFIMHTGATAPYYYLYLDDISIETVPSCAAPWNLAVSNITSSGATASFNNLTGTSFQIEYGPTGFIPGTGLATTVNGVSSPYAITGLNSNTYYDYYVSDMCDTTMQAGPFTFKTDCTAQLSGTYTVGGTPGATNFATLDSALSVLVGCGVSGPVTFNLQGGTHSTAVMMDVIQGASATNTVTFNGMGVGMDTIAIPSGVTIGMNFNGTSYVTFKNVTIDATGTNRAVWFHEGAHHITFEDCDILGSISTSSLYAVIVAAKTETSVSSTGDNADDITIKGCTISGGYYGITMYGGGTAAYNENITLEDNTIVDAYYYGVRLYYFDNVSITGNNVELAYTFSYGMYLYYMRNFNVSSNTVMAGGYGLYSYYANQNITPAVRSTISNNFFGASNTYGMSVSYPNAVNIHHNSARGGNRGLYLYSYQATSLETDVRNNILYGASGEGIYFTNSQGGSITADYNLYYTGGSNLAYWKNASRSNLAALQAADTANNASSIQNDPGFLSATDFHITGTAPNDVADNSTSIVVDIDGDSRPASGSTTKDIGADEYTPLNWDASLQAIIVPLGGCGDSTTMVEVVVKNFGLNTITSLPITVNYTGGMTGTVSVTATVSIAQGTTDTISVGTFNTYAGAVGVDFMGYTSLVGDQKGNNDTLSKGPGAYVPVEPVTHGMIDTVCASVDSVGLWAYHIPGTEYAWYDAAIAGNKVANGDSIMVPTNGITTYYVAYDSATANPQIGAGTISSTSTYITPYKTFYMDGRAQYLVLASELQAMGIAGGEINSLAFEVALSASAAMNDFTIKIGGTSVSAMTGTFQPNTGMTTVYNSTFTPVSGWNVHTFTNPYIWNGADNLLIEVCFDNNAWTSNTSVYYETTSFNSVTDGYADLSSSSGCTAGNITNQQASTSRPNMQFNMKTIACSDVRKPVSFAVNTDTAFAAAFTSTVNVNGADVDFDGSASTGNVYTWNFGDGNTGTGAMASHTYATAGTWTACLTVEDTVCNTVDSICQTVITTIGIDESLLNQSLNVFPNPSNGKFRVEFQVEGLKNITVRINTLLGQEIYTSKPGNVSGEYREEIDLSNEATGIYVLQIITDDNVVSRRVTIRK